jgi:hypothetical protein
MTRVINFVAELLCLEEELKDLEQAQADLPFGAHIHSLIQLSIERIQEQIAALQRSCVLAPAQVAPA